VFSWLGGRIACVHEYTHTRGEERANGRPATRPQPFVLPPDRPGFYLIISPLFSASYWREYWGAGLLAGSLDNDASLPSLLTYTRRKLFSANVSFVDTYLLLYYNDSDSLMMVFNRNRGHRFLPLSVVLVRCRRLQDLLVLQGTLRSHQESSLKTTLTV